MSTEPEHLPYLDEKIGYDPEFAGAVEAVASAGVK